MIFLEITIEEVFFSFLQERWPVFLAKLGKDKWPPSSYFQREWQFEHLAAFPSSYVLCLQDMTLPPAWQERFALQLHCDRTVKIDAGHQVMNTRPHGLAEILLAEAAG